MKRGRGQGHFYEEELNWGYAAWKRECSEETLIAPFLYLKGNYRKAEEGLLTQACSDMTRRDIFKLKQGRFRSDISKKFPTASMMRHWNGFPREIVDAQSLEVLIVRFNGALSRSV